MRTTVELPEELMRAAKAKAVEGGESLKDLFARAIAKEIGRRAPRTTATRVSLPLIARGAEPTVDISNEQVADALDADDIERFGSQ
jgi:hypothetical protein